VVAFLIENIKRILDFIESVINSIAEIARGAIGAAANYIEQAWRARCPSSSGFLARLLGISGITDKIHQPPIKKMQCKVEQANRQGDRQARRLRRARPMDAAKSGAAKGGRMVEAAQACSRRGRREARGLSSPATRRT